MTSDQKHKALVRDFWRRLEAAENHELKRLVDSATAGDIEWYAPAPIDFLPDNHAFVSGYLAPLRRAFPDLQRNSHIFMGGESCGRVDGTGDGRTWVAGTGYLTATFVHDWLGIPANGKRVSVRWGEFCLMEDGKIARVYFLLDLIDLMRQVGVHVLPPSRGRDGLYPPPENADGVLPAVQDVRKTEKSITMIREFLFEGLNRYDRANLESMGVARYFSDGVKWYGPGGIGAMLNLREFEDLHQKPWLHAFPDRLVQDLDSLFAEGDYAASSGWKAVKATHRGQYLDCPATNNTIYTNGIDFWRRRGDKYIENWVFVDMIHLFRQFGVELMERIPPHG